MSTRANIIIKDEINAIQIYKHYDGYPSEILKGLNKALKYSWPLPRMEASEFAAAVVRSFKTGAGDCRIDGTADFPHSLHGDIAFYYIVTPDKTKGTWRVEEYLVDDDKQYVVYWLDKSTSEAK